MFATEQDIHAALAVCKAVFICFWVPARSSPVIIKNFYLPVWLKEWRLVLHMIGPFTAQSLLVSSLQIEKENLKIHFPIIIGANDADSKRKFVEWFRDLVKGKAGGDACDRRNNIQPELYHRIMAWRELDEVEV